MKKFILSSIITASTMLFGMSAAQADVIKLKLGHVAPTNEPYHKAAEKFAELVNKNTAGAVQVEIFPNSLLGSGREMLEGLQLGSVDITLTTSAVLASFLPKTQVLA